VSEEVLQKYPDLKLKVFAIWQPISEADNGREAAYNAQRYTDPRFEHFWDAGLVTGHWYKNTVLPTIPELQSNNVFSTGFVWDAFFLYDKNQKWTDLPPYPLSAGAPITEGFHVLEEALHQFIVGAPRPQVPQESLREMPGGHH
jgi:hypothetical protein